MEIVIDRLKLNSKIRHISAEDVINMLNSLEPFLNKSNDVVEKIIIKSPTQSSFALGRIGEINVQSILEKHFETEKPLSHSGDLVVWKKEYPNVRIMIEVKNYSKTVPQEQYRKFEYELELGKYSGGIFITNQQVSGVSHVVDSNKVVLTKFDPEIILATTEILWSYLNRQTWMRTLDHEQVLGNHCLVLNDNIDVIKRALIKIGHTQKTTATELSNCTLLLNKVSHKTTKSINQLINNINPSHITETTGRVVLPNVECAIVKVGREIIEQFLSQFIGENRVIAAFDNKKNICEYQFDEKKIVLKFYKTRIDFLFSPRTRNFTDYDNINFIDGNAVVVITAKNYQDEKVWLNISQFF